MWSLSWPWNNACSGIRWLFLKPPWHRCCVAHDYWYADQMGTKGEGDRRFSNCIRVMGYQLSSRVVYWIVDHFGWPSWLQCKKEKGEAQ